jgi:predicted RNase H-like nuclease (RuvC/YqgF family)
MKEGNEVKEVKVHIDDLHFEHQAWERELTFFKNELSFFTDRLEEVAARYTSMDVMKDLEKFQNHLMIQGNAIDTLLHDVNEHEHFLAKFSEENPVAVDRVLFDDHGPLRERMETNREIINEFKKDYQRFLAKWM